MDDILTVLRLLVAILYIVGMGILWHRFIMFLVDKSKLCACLQYLFQFLRKLLIKKNK
jgi:hypothetical protein